MGRTSMAVPRLHVPVAHRRAVDDPESVFAAGLLTPGVYCVAHGRALPFPGVAG